MSGNCIELKFEYRGYIIDYSGDDDSCACSYEDLFDGAIDSVSFSAIESLPFFETHMGFLEMIVEDIDKNIAKYCVDSCRIWNKKEKQL